jgi:hypothetical protein
VEPPVSRFFGADRKSGSRARDRPQRARGRAEQLHLVVATSVFAKTSTQFDDRLFVGVEKPPLGQKRFRERITDRPFHRLTRVGPRNDQGVYVHPGGIERQVACFHLFVVDGHKHQVDVGLGLHRVVREAATRDRRQDGAVLLYAGS